ncbi:MAG: hypothetical protein KAW56_01565 [Candidatus Marinimicrobia bacterium]|nr:hypothetical protein [Candidatus Neomarinimicrobiota bacterium]
MRKTLLKDTIFWIFGVAFIMLMNVNKANENEHYFKTLILDNVKLVIILEFIMNLYVFNFIVELILIPILFIVVVMNTFAETKEEYNPVKKMTDFILTIFGIWIIIHALYNILVNYQEFIQTDNLLSFCLTPFLMFAYLPFIYFMALSMIYEVFFVRIDFLNKDKSHIKYAKRKIFVFCNFNLRKLNKFSRSLRALRFDNRNDILLAIQIFKNSRKLKNGNN